MSGELYTVEEAAERLKLHTKTILRAIRDGRLRATRVGKSYRILASDLDSFAGVPARPVAPGEASVTSIVDVPDVGAVLAQKLAASVTNALNPHRARRGRLRADVVYEPERRHLRIIVTGSPGDTANLLGLLDIWLEQLTP